MDTSDQVPAAVLTQKYQNECDKVTEMLPFYSSLKFNSNVVLL